MIEIRFPDQSVRSYPAGTTPFEVAQSISEGLARNVLSAKFNRQTVEATTPLKEDGDLQLFTWNDKEGKTAFWHSSALLLERMLNSNFSLQNRIDRKFGRRHHYLL